MGWEALFPDLVKTIKLSDEYYVTVKAPGLLTDTDKAKIDMAKLMKFQGLDEEGFAKLSPDELQEILDEMDKMLALHILDWKMPADLPKPTVDNTKPLKQVPEAVKSLIQQTIDELDNKENFTTGQSSTQQ